MVLGLDASKPLTTLTTFGTRVLLRCSIRAVQQRYPTVPMLPVPSLPHAVTIAYEVTCVVYTGDTDVTPSEFLLQARRL